jgi:hypothetical protein
MRKLKLDVSALRVESFDAAEGREESCGGESCDITSCLTCLCPHTGPQPSCDPCSRLGDCTFDPATCP